jgi:pSer/pThr/pTyr-binding forkhead associated (FHA) protein
MRRVSASEAADAPGMADSSALLEAERSGRQFLVFTDRDDRQRVFLFADSDSVSVGRLPSSDLVIDWDAKVSRLHARFERLEDTWVVVDDGLSSNGTFVNEARLSGRRRLSDGDVVRFGATTVLFRSPAAGQPPAGDAAETTPTVQLSSTQRRVLEALCRPCEAGARSASPASDEQIAEELVVSVAEVRDHLRVLYAKLGVDAAPPDEARARLVEQAFAAGLISPRER